MFCNDSDKGGKNEIPALMLKNCGKTKVLQGHLQVYCFLSILDSERTGEQKGEGVKENEEERRRTGQLQCGQVCRVSRERERLE